MLPHSPATWTLIEKFCSVQCRQMPSRSYLSDASRTTYVSGVGLGLRLLGRSTRQVLMLTNFSSTLRMCLSWAVWASANMASHYIWPLTTQWIPSDYSSNGSHATEIQCGKKELQILSSTFLQRITRFFFKLLDQANSWRLWISKGVNLEPRPRDSVSRDTPIAHKLWALPNVYR